MHSILDFGKPRYRGRYDDAMFLLVLMDIVHVDIRRCITNLNVLRTRQADWDHLQSDLLEEAQRYAHQ